MRTILRYPGGKSRKADEIISFFNADNDVLIEPMVGGGGVSVRYATVNPNSSIVMSDLNPIVYSFWVAVTKFIYEFVNLLEPMNIDVYVKYRNAEVCDIADADGIVKNAMKFFVLNKCSFNGYVFENTVPVGGWKQTGKWLVDWCWNVEKLKKDVLNLHTLLSGRTDVYNLSVFDMIDKYAECSNVNWYIDPPYFKEGKKMYGRFGHFDHVMLSRAIDRLNDFVISYDNNENIVNLYSGERFKIHMMNVTSSRKIDDNNKLKLQKEILITGQAGDC